MQSRLMLSKDLPLNCKTVRRFLDRENSTFIEEWRFLPVPVKIIIKPEIEDRGARLCRLDFQVNFSIPGAPVWFFFHNRFLKIRINYFTERIYFFSISENFPENLPFYVFSKNSLFKSIITYIPPFGRDACLLTGGSHTIYSNNLLIPLFVHREDLARILPPPFKLPHDCGELIKIFFKISEFRTICDTEFSEGISSLLPDAGISEFYTRTDLITDTDYYKGYLRFVLSDRRFFLTENSQKISVENGNMKFCFLDKKRDIKTRIYALPGRPFSNGDLLPELFETNITIFEFMKDSLKIKISERMQKIPLNKIHHVTVKSRHPSTDISRLFSETIGIELSEKFPRDAYYIPDIHEVSVTGREVPLTRCQYRTQKSETITHESNETLNFQHSENL